MRQVLHSVTILCAIVHCVDVSKRSVQKMGKF
jgi:hypothetical protein